MNKYYVLVLLILVNTSYAQKMRSRGRAFNPDISINALFISQNSSRDIENDGMNLEEVELQFTSDVDSYLTSWVRLALEREAATGEYAIEPEEVFIETLSIPNITVRAGKSKLAIGKHNILHHHAFPFVNAPLINENILGEEGLTETGIAVSGLLPLSWFSEYSFSFTQGENEDLFNHERKNKKILVGRYKNLWELSDTLTFELGFSGAKGKNSNNLYTTLLGGDFTLKWRPLSGGRARSFEWGTEYLQKDKNGSVDGKLSGLVTYLKYQLAQRWFVQYRYDYLGLNDTKTITATKRHTALLAFIPSEFSGVRLQYENVDDGQTEDEKRISLQLNISIGAHPAHLY